MTTGRGWWKRLAWWKREPVALVPAAPPPNIPLDELEPVLRIMNGFCHEVDQEMQAEGMSATHRARLIIGAQRRFIKTVQEAYARAKAGQPQAAASEGAA